MFKIIILGLMVSFSSVSYANEAIPKEPVNERVQIRETPGWERAVFWQAKLEEISENMEDKEIKAHLQEPMSQLSQAVNNRNQYFLEALYEVHKAQDGNDLDWKDQTHQDDIQKLFARYLPMLIKDALFKEIEDRFNKDNRVKNQEQRRLNSE